jgi:hypothetical protein
MDHMVPQCFTHCSWVGGVPVGCHPFWSLANHGECLFEKLLGGLHISFLTQTGIHQVAICINGAIQITPFSMHACPYVSSTYHDGPACPRRLVRSCAVMRGANRLSHSRTASWVNSQPRSRNISARSRRLNLYRSRHRTTRRTTSVGYSRKLNGVPVRSLKFCLQAEQRNV